MAAPEKLGIESVVRTYVPGHAQLITRLARKIDELIDYAEQLEARVEECPNCQSEGAETPLPSDFPHLDILGEAGITSYESLKEYEMDYTAIDGIGSSRAHDIHDALG